jgi:putative nucleotidyltransferase with HDIG domain
VITERSGRKNVVLSIGVIAVTVVFVALSLTIGRPDPAPEISLTVGEASPMDFMASANVNVPDEAATERAKQEAIDNTPAVYRTDPNVASSVNGSLQRYLAAIRSAPLGGVAEVSLTPTTTTTTTTEPPTTTTSTAAPDEGQDTTTTSSTEAPTTSEPPTTTTSTTLPPEEQVDMLKDQFTFRREEPRMVLLGQLNADIASLESGATSAVYPQIEDLIQQTVATQLAEPIAAGDLEARQNELTSNPPPFFPGPGYTGFEFLGVQYGLDDVEQAVADIAAESLQANKVVDEQAWETQRQIAASGVEDKSQTYFAGNAIALTGERLTQVQIDAIERLGLLDAGEGASPSAAAALGAIAVLLAAFFLWRIAPGMWSQPRHFALLGVLLILAAIASRIPNLIVGESNPELAFVLPAVMFGYIAAILYDPRTAVLMAVPVATFTAISTNDIALTIYAAAATVAPVAFVSAVSSRRELRLAVTLSALVLAPLAGAVAWMYLGRESVVPAAMFAVIGGIIAGLAAQGLLSFLENLFQMTTTITLLDLTDRNHPALRLLEERAPGTFNHSILVGTLAGKAARAIGANALLAQAAAYYHDLGKTEQPQFFIENQFGVSNPHDELAPEESATIIRDHVTNGLKLARQYRIPDEVSDGIRMHHGTGLMRYFYHQALDADPGVEPALYRHAGEKPRRKEMAILMISDAVEGAARALAQQEDPSADSLRKLVDAVVGEKLEDGQLDQSDLTFGDLTRVKHAMVQALIGYYHTRIPYPGFPGPRAEDR